MENLFNLKNRTIIVTGAAGLLGSKICQGLIDFGARVIMVDVDRKKIEILSKEIENNNLVNGHSFIVDSTKEDSVKFFLKKILKKFGHIDGLINVAYPRNKEWGKIFEKINFESWKENIDLHLGSYFLFTQGVVKQMIKQKRGNIINFASIYGFLGPNFSIYQGTKMTVPAEYSVIKAGIINFTRYLATYLAKYNIRVNCISPGGVFNYQPDIFVKKYSHRVPLGRMAKPDEMVGGVIFLSSDASDYITGHNLIIDGGLSIW